MIDSAAARFAAERRNETDLAATENAQAELADTVEDARVEMFGCAWRIGPHAVGSVCVRDAEATVVRADHGERRRRRKPNS